CARWFPNFVHHGSRKLCTLNCQKLCIVASRLQCLEYGTLKEEVGDHISGKETELLKLKDDLGSCAVPKQVRKLMAQSEFKERNTDHLPDEVLENLKTKYNVTSAAIRKAKQRALEGLRNC